MWVALIQVYARSWHSADRRRYAEPRDRRASCRAAEAGWRSAALPTARVRETAHTDRMQSGTPSSSPRLTNVQSVGDKVSAIDTRVGGICVTQRHQLECHVCVERRSRGNGDVDGTEGAGPVIRNLRQMLVALYSDLSQYRERNERSRSNTARFEATSRGPPGWRPSSRRSSRSGRSS